MVLLGIIGHFTGSAAAQETPPAPEGVPVARVEFVGLETISEGYVRRIVKTREGQSLLYSQLEADVRELMRTRKFIDVLADTRLEEGQAVVTFRMREKPDVAGVEIIGNEHFKDDELYALVPTPGQPLDRYEAERGRDEMLRKYKEAGFYYAEVDLDERVMEQDRYLAYRITEGPRVRVREISFEGNLTFSDRTLRSKIQTNTYIWIFRTGALSEEQVERDVLALEQFYRNEGFLDARASYRLEFDEVDRTRLRVIFVIEEGPRYRVSEIEITGNEAFETAYLRSRLNLQPGDYLRDEVLQRDLQTLKDTYGEIGYVAAQVVSDYEYLADAPDAVRLRFVINERGRSRVGRITIRGNTQTQDRVIRRELRFFPGEDFNLLKTRTAERRLRETGLFNRASITPLPDEGGEREALVEVEEADAVLFLIGVGVSTDSGVLGSISLSNRNFDLFDWPRTWGEFIRGQSFRGAGQSLRISLEPGTELTRFRIDFREPYLFDQPVSYGASYYLWQRGRERYDEQRLGLTQSLGRRFETGPLEGWAIEGAFRLEGVDIDEVDPLAAREIREAKGSHLLTSVKGTIARDTTDSRFRPTEGYRFDVSWEQVGAAGGDHTFGQPSAGFSWYHTTHTDLLDRKSVLAVRADTGVIVGDAPVFERYYGGGFGSIRGFRYRGVSPRNGIGDDAVGGDFILLVGAEYSFPVYGDNIYGVTFVDMGTVEESVEITSWRASVGAGLRIYVDFFGPVPIVLDFAVPVAKEDEDETEIFNFSIGASF